MPYLFELSFWPGDTVINATKSHRRIHCMVILQQVEHQINLNMHDTRLLFLSIVYEPNKAKKFSTGCHEQYRLMPLGEATSC